MKFESSSSWPKGPTCWIDARTLYVSVPFTWFLPELKTQLSQRSFEWDRAVVGGPAVELMPDFLQELDHVWTGMNYPGVLQRIHPLATKTTEGCPRRCKFCAVPIIQGRLVELEDWPNLPVLIDNNLLAASESHFERVINRLVGLEWVDFNQGLDSRLLTDGHAQQLARIRLPIIRLALDHIAYRDSWEAAFERLLAAGVAKRRIRSYALCGFDSDPTEAWERCNWISSKGIKVAPMWFHDLDCLEHNTVSPKQRALGWTDYERRRLMQWFYKHKQARRYGGDDDQDRMV